MKTKKEMEAELRKVKESIGDKLDEIKTVRSAIESIDKVVQERDDSKPTEDELAKKKEKRAELTRLNDEYVELTNKRDELAGDLMIEVDQSAGRMSRMVFINNAGDDEDKIAEKFSMTKVVRSLKTGKALTDFEKEITDDGDAELRELGHSKRGIYVPGKALMRGKAEQRDHTVGTTTTGGHTVDTVTMPFIDVLRNAIIFPGMGAQLLTGLQGSLKFPRKTVATSLASEGETDTTAETTQTWDTVTMSPKRIAGYSDMSMQLALQSGEVFEQIIRNDLAAAVAQRMNTLVINGSGSNDEPTGILASAIGAVEIDTNGGALTWADVVNLEKEVDQDNALDGAASYLTNAKVRAELKKIVKVASTSADFLLDRDGTLNSYGVTYTNAVPSDLTKAAGSSLSALIFGVWNNLMIGQWGGVDILLDPYTQKADGIDRVVVNAFFDVALRHLESFAAADDITTTTA